MVRINPEVGRHRINLEFAGVVTAEELTRAAAELQTALTRLRPPIDVLSDIRALERLDESLLAEFRRVGGVLGHFGVRRVVRVVGKSALAAVHVERLARTLKDHAAHLAFSLEEAEQVFQK